MHVPKPRGAKAPKPAQNSTRNNTHSHDMQRFSYVFLTFFIRFFRQIEYVCHAYANVFLTFFKRFSHVFYLFFMRLKRFSHVF